MESGSGFSGNAAEVAARTLREGLRMDSSTGPDPLRVFSRRGQVTELIANLPDAVRCSAMAGSGEYDARRLRSQREVIRDVMLAAAECDTWLTLGELRGLTRYGEASISAQLRHLRKLENGGYEVAKRHREGSGAANLRGDERGECVWEYRMAGRC